MERVNRDNESYYGFTTPHRVTRGLNTLEGLLEGVTADTKLPMETVKLFWEWLEDYDDLSERHPFNELMPVLREALDDDKLEQEEVEDLTWLIQRLNPDSGIIGDVKAEMQQLHGLLAGIISDGHITNEELTTLSRWMEDREHLKTIWPYDEIESLILEVKRDKKIDEKEQALLVRFFSEFASYEGHRAVTMPMTELGKSFAGLCAVCPDVRFDGRLFCFTGTSERMTRKQIVEIVETRGGKFSPRVVQELSYLVIGADGNPCWAFACYGRKVEQAVKYRKGGHPLVLVHENDFWDAVGDA